MKRRNVKVMVAEDSNELTALLTRLSKEEYCYLTTIGRVSGKPHEIEIWFGVMDEALYLLSGSGADSDWVKNLRKTPEVKLRIGKHQFEGRARTLEDVKADAPVRKLLASKYEGWKEGRKLSGWARTALPVEIKFDSR